MMLCRLSSPRQLILAVLLCGLLLSSSSLVVSAEETLSSSLTSLTTTAAVAVPGDERYQRRKTWDVTDVFGFLMMMVSSECGIGAEIRLGDHHLCHQCNNGNDNSCRSLCAMSSDNHKSQYSRYCGDGGTETETQYSYNEDGSSNADAYVGNSETGSVTTGENYSMGFQFWMVATAAAVAMALVAIHIGQRKERENSDEIADDESSVGANVTGSVGRRLSAISAFADGVMPSSNKQVELAEYHLESDDTPPSPPPPSYPQSQFV